MLVKMWLAFVYFLLTLIACGQAAMSASIRVGGAALLGYALCYFATATLSGSYRARRIKDSSNRDLATIGVIAVALVAAGLALITWSGFRIGLFGVVMPGVYWALLGVVIAALTTKKEHAL